MERYAIGIDLGGTSVKYAVVAASGGILFHGEHASRASDGAEAVLDAILRGVEACRAFAAREGLTLEGVGIGTPGVVSDDGRTVLGGAENIAGYPEDFFDDAADVGRALGLLERKRLPDTRAYEKLVRFLVGKGFDYRCASEAVKLRLEHEDA